MGLLLNLNWVSDHNPRLNHVSNETKPVLVSDYCISIIRAQTVNMDTKYRTTKKHTCLGDSIDF